MQYDNGEVVPIAGDYLDTDNEGTWFTVKLDPYADELDYLDSHHQRQFAGTRYHSDNGQNE